MTAIPGCDMEKVWTEWAERIRSPRLRWFEAVMPSVTSRLMTLRVICLQAEAQTASTDEGVIGNLLWEGSTVGR
eukprot:CAMPEP_0183742462 /NCGR_PEP_ID=MMETSP0737-20130205/64711_1 /TAXON_ID=385413 /ORGANISM="Thalassiosira miniscula, Strain CCMP1093" /LENGTH=73 /DNA_ID=CAMNT_0025978049 /DNA_START=540 /DNA_END=761 /DNA_ORIENTATION=-